MIMFLTTFALMIVAVVLTIIMVELNTPEED